MTKIFRKSTAALWPVKSPYHGIFPVVSSPFWVILKKKMDKKHAVKQKMLIFEPFYESSFLLICPMFLAIWFI